MKKIILTVAVLALGFGNQASAIPIPFQEAPPALISSVTGSINEIAPPSMSFKAIVYDASSPTFAKLLPVSAHDGNGKANTLSARIAWWQVVGLLGNSPNANGKRHGKKGRGHLGNFPGKPGVDNPSPVPEPATMLLFGSGLLGLAIMGRKRNKQNL